MKANQQIEKIGKFYLIGVNHSVQWNRDLLITVNYMQYLENQIKELNVDLVAEEFSEEALERNNTKNTSSDYVSKKILNKNCILCDPDEKTRKMIGYPDKIQLNKKFGVRSTIEGTVEHKKRKEYERTFFPIREKYWLEQIKNSKLSFERMIFICGSEHLNSFMSLLEKNNYDVFILDKKFDLI